MVARLTLPQVRRTMAAAQGLGARLETVDAAVRSCAGIYGSAPTAHFSLAARVEGYHQSDLEDALVERRSLLRVPAMRSSVYLLPPDLAFHGIALLAERNADWFLKILEMDRPAYESLARQVEDVIGDGSMTATEIRKALGGAAPDGPRLTYALRHMGNEARIVKTATRGGIRSQRFEYAVARRWTVVPDELPGLEEALERLTPLWLAAHGPASVDDLAWWAGVTKEQAARAIDTVGAVPVDVEGLGGDLFVDPAAPEVEPAPPDEVSLLPVWDVWMMSHRDRTRYLDDVWRDRVVDKSGNVTNVILQDGVIVGVWDLDGTTLLYGTFGPGLGEEAVAAASHCFAAIAPVTELRFVEPRPLSGRGQNAFQAPLRS